MILTEVIGDDWPTFADSNKIELTKLEHVDTELLADICKDHQWTVTFHGHFVKALVSEVILPKFAFESYASMLGDTDIPDEIGVTFTDLWYHDKELYAVAKVERQGWPRAKSIERGCILDEALICDVLITLLNSFKRDKADEIDLIWVLGDGIFYYPSDKFPVEWIRDLSRNH